jgi:hypothetical protein
VGELLEGALATIRRYPAATIGPAFAVTLVVSVIRFFVMYLLLHGLHSAGISLFHASSQQTHRENIANGIDEIVGLLADVLLSGMLTVVVGKAVLGLPMTIGQAWSTIRPRLLRLLGATLSVALIVGVAGIVAVLPGIVLTVVGAATSETALLVIGVILLVAGGLLVAFWLAISLTFTTPALILEEIGVGQALRRSRTLVHDSWWRVFGILLLSGLIAELFTGIVQVPFRIAAGAGGFLSDHSTNIGSVHYLLLTGIGQLIGATLVAPFTVSIIALLYVDRRMRSEGLAFALQQAAQPSVAQ